MPKVTYKDQDIEGCIRIERCHYKPRTTMQTGAQGDTQTTRHHDRGTAIQHFEVSADGLKRLAQIGSEPMGELVVSEDPDGAEFASDTRLKSWSQTTATFDGVMMPR